MNDIIADLGAAFLGSRLKRLAERFQADAARVIADAGLPVQPMHMPLLAAIDRGPLTVSHAAAAIGMSQPAVTRSLTQLVALGLLATSSDGRDQRHKTITLTAAGRDLLSRCRTDLWPRIGAAVATMCDVPAVLATIAGLEAELARESLPTRVAQAPRILDFTDDLAAAFRAINAEWIEAMFTLEANDRAILDHPRAAVVDRGGIIRFVDVPGLGVVGTCALIRIGDGVYELTKMGVLAAARGRKAGEVLLEHVVAEARVMAAAGTLTRLYLLTNTKCAAAIHLYEKAGFVHDSTVMADFGARYARCDVAMSLPLAVPAAGASLPGA